MTPSSASTYRRFVPVGIFALLVLILMFSALYSVSDLISARQNLASERELLTKLQERAARAGSTVAIDPVDYLFIAPSQGVATGELQKQVSDVLTSAGADLQLSEIIPSDEEGDAGRLAIAINFEIDESQLIGLLHAIENAKPAMIIERLSLWIVASGQSPARQRLQGTATFVAAWRIAS